MVAAPRVEVEIKGGENAGRTVAYANVVRKIIPVGMWHGESVTLSLPASAILTEVAPACAVLLQVDGTGPIIGAAWISAGGA